MFVASFEVLLLSSFHLPSARKSSLHFWICLISPWWLFLECHNPTVYTFWCHEEAVLHGNRWPSKIALPRIHFLGKGQISISHFGENYLLLSNRKTYFFCFSWAHVKTLEVPPPNKMALICYCLVIVHDNVLMSKVTAEEHLYWNQVWNFRCPNEKI